MAYLKPVLKFFKQTPQCCRVGSTDKSLSELRSCETWVLPKSKASTTSLKMLTKALHVVGTKIYATITDLLILWFCT